MFLLTFSFISFKMNSQGWSPEASRKHFQEEILGGQYLQHSCQKERNDKGTASVNAISVIKTVGEWKNTHSLQTTESSSLQSGGAPSSIKKKKNFFSCFQKLQLEKFFVHNPYPSREMCEHLALRFATTPHSMKIWFKNRRARQRRSSSSQPCCAQPPLQHHHHHHVHQVYYPKTTITKQPYTDPKLHQIKNPSGPKVILEPQHSHRRSAFSVYIKAQDKPDKKD